MSLGDGEALRVFLSYRRGDSIGIAGRIHDQLARHFGSDSVYYDIDKTPLGVDFRKHIDRMVADCDVMLVVIGPRWVDAVDEQGQRRLDQPGDYVRLEVEAALRREIPVVPLLVEGATIPQPHALPETLAELSFRNGTPVRHDPDFHSDIDRLIQRLAPSSPPPAGAHIGGDRAERTEPPVVRLSHPNPPNPKATVTETPAGSSVTNAGTTELTGWQAPARDLNAQGSPGPRVGILRGHSGFVVGQVDACAVAPDGTWIVSASWDGTLRIWDVASGETRSTLLGHTDYVHGCAVAPDGTWIVSASRDKTLQIWDVASGENRRTLLGHTNDVRGCAVAPDGTWIVSASDDHNLRIWDVASGENRRTLSGHTNDVYGCAVAPDGTWIVSASKDKTLRIWDVASGETRRTLSGHTSWVYGCAVAPDGTWIVSASRDKTLRIWDVASGETRRTLSGHTNWVQGCAVAPDGTWIVSASRDKTLRIWDVASGETRRTLSGHTNWVQGCAVAPDGTWIVSASVDKTLRIWDVASGRTVGGA